MTRAAAAVRLRMESWTKQAKNRHATAFFSEDFPVIWIVYENSVLVGWAAGRVGELPPNSIPEPLRSDFRMFPADESQWTWLAVGVCKEVLE